MAAQSEHERAKRFQAATQVSTLTKENSQLHDRKTMKQKIQKERQWLEERRQFTDGAARDLLEEEACRTIQRQGLADIARPIIDTHFEPSFLDFMAT